MRHLRVEKTDGTIATATDKDVKDVTAQIANDAPAYTDLKEKHITVPGLAPGVVVDYDVVTHITKPLAPNEFWYKHHFAQQIIVLDEELEINVPAARKINLHSTDSHFTQEARDARKIYLWKRANLSSAPIEVSAEKKGGETENPPATVELSSFASWNDVARWYATLEKGRSTPTPANPRQSSRAHFARHNYLRENSGSLRLRLQKYPLRQPPLRPRPLPTPHRSRSFRQSIWRLQRQAHSSRRHVRCNRRSRRRRANSLRAQARRANSLPNAIRSPDHRHPLARRSHKDHVARHHRRSSALSLSGSLSPRQESTNHRSRRHRPHRRNSRRSSIPFLSSRRNRRPRQRSRQTHRLHSLSPPRRQ